jgi:hypothetical protein
MLSVAQDLAGGGNGDGDGDGVLDGYERWYYGATSQGAGSDSDGDGATLVQEFQAGSDPTDADTDDDGFPDGQDAAPQDRFAPGLTRVTGRLRGVGTGEGDVTVKGDVSSGVSGFNPAVAAVTLTLADDDTIYQVTIPAGTMVANRSGTTFKLNDPDGVNAGLVSARVRIGAPGRKSTVLFRARDVSLTNADAVDHEITVAVDFAIGALSRAAQLTVRGSSAKIATP